MSDGRASYRAVQTGSGWQVLGPEDRVIVECRDKNTAGHYAQLLAAAWQSGFRAGYAARGARAID